MTTVKEPVRTYTNVPKPIKAPSYAPPLQVPVESPEREMVPVRRQPAQGTSHMYQLPDGRLIPAVTNRDRGDWDGRNAMKLVQGL